jgi:signal transduction histidine kinase
MKLFISILFSVALIVACFPMDAGCQPGTLNQLKEKLDRIQQKPNYLQDTAYANTLNQIAFIYADSYPDSAFAMLAGHAERCKASDYREGEVETYKILGNAYQTKGNYEKALEQYEQSYQLAEKINFKKSFPGILNNIGLVHLNQGNYPSALSKFYETLKAAEAVNDQFVIGSALNNIAIIHFYQGKMNEAEITYQKTLQIAVKMNDTVGIILAYNNIGEVNLEQNNPAKALQNFNIGYKLASLNNNPEMLVVITNNLGNTYYKTDSLQNAVYQFETALRLSKQKGYGTAACKSLIGLAKVRNRQGMFKEALVNGLEGLQKADEMGQAQLIRDANEIVASIYESLNEGINALKHFKMYKIYADSLNNISSERAAASYKSGYEISKKEIEFERKNLQQRWLTFSAFAGLFSLGIILWIINRSKKRLNHTYKDLQQKNLVIEAQKLQAEETLNQLQVTQSQLIQSEKMASLGELTAGIAHEIQNPLNFVNNFSEVNKELLIEMTEEIDKENWDEAKLLAKDVINNQEKINHHGKRADAIVKGMLQHSRSSSGQKEPTDINKLADEYLRLAYHGLRAKDKSFNATLKTNYDESIESIHIIPQDVGRVILNLITNAFYSVTEKKKALWSNDPGSIYEPTVSVITKKQANTIEIRVADNGNGMPQKIVDKIFQPFFTTKPTGQGTGLGLSLSYDIIKTHGGELKVENKEGEGAQFIIILKA